MLEYFPSVSQSHGAEFPSPHSGILFLYQIRQDLLSQGIRVSVPSFGDSFFMN